MNNIPRRGDIVWLNFDPTIGHEQSGRRPALIISPESYNQKIGLALAYPITSKVKGYAFEVAIPEGLPITGVVLADQIKSIDWVGRNAEFICALPSQIYEDVIAKTLTLLE
jgi:mRNA interferase MazF